jgi:hypothetical protein
VQNVFGWSPSPDGRSIAFETGSGTFGKLAVVDATTGTVRQLLQLSYAPTAVWSPHSSELLAYGLAKSQKCWSLSRVPVDGRHRPSSRPVRPRRRSRCSRLTSQSFGS